MNIPVTLITKYLTQSGLLRSDNGIELVYTYGDIQDTHHKFHDYWRVCYTQMQVLP